MAAPKQFQNLRVKRSVLKRTRKRLDLPTVALYMGPLIGQGKQRVLKPDGEEQLVQDGILASHFKLVSGPKGKELLDEHWPKIVAELADAKAQLAT